jgi:hypothetical protein
MGETKFLLYTLIGMNIAMAVSQGIIIGLIGRL